MGADATADQPRVHVAATTLLVRDKEGGVQRNGGAAVVLTEEDGEGGEDPSGATYVPNLLTVKVIAWG